ncbi:hypothetical protein HDU97_009151 [Phlyctochytrium planicorne]|nr:hypothetical protein HDU97_009151 [Phlyctochytrium planicorne]
MKYTFAIVATAIFSPFSAAYPQPQSMSKDFPDESHKNAPTIDGIPYKIDLVRNNDGTFTGTFSAVSRGYKDCSSLRSWATTQQNNGFCDGLKIYDDETRRSYKSECISGYNAVADTCVRYFDGNRGMGSFDYKFQFTGKVIGKDTTGSSDKTITKKDNAKPWDEPYYDTRQDYVDLTIRATSIDQCKYIEAFGTKPDHSGFCDGLPNGPEGFEDCVKSLHFIYGFCESFFNTGNNSEYSLTLGIPGSKFPEWSKKFPTKSGDGKKNYFSPLFFNSN